MAGGVFLGGTSLVEAAAGYVADGGDSGGAGAAAFATGAAGAGVLGPLAR